MYVTANEVLFFRQHQLQMLIGTTSDVTREQVAQEQLVDVTHIVTCNGCSYRGIF